MTWFKIDDTAPFHVKVVSAGNEAYGAWVRAGAWSSGQGKDGFVPTEIAKVIAPAQKVWARLVAVRLLEEVDGGYQVHDFLGYNPSAAQVAEKRAAQHEAKQRAGRIGGQRSGEARREQSRPEAETKQPASGLLEAEPKQNEAPSRPVPEESKIPPVVPPPAEPTEAQSTEPPTAAPSSRRIAKRKPERTKCPESIDPEAGAWCAEHGIPDPRLDPESRRFLDHHAGKGNRQANWLATWRNWASGRFIGSAPTPRAATYAPPEPVRTGTRLLTFDDPPRAPRPPPRPAPTTDATVPGDAIALVAGIGLGGRS